ncbi:30S ribosomal protein S17 [Candidatus Woesearchaeota archaeon]|nr:30S ribosomal protein S17P [uncultured archaeon]MBS3139405.1 30S ribosomal protein S17 [Candidatus Woesearchaeota archaeon]
MDKQKHAVKETVLGIPAPARAYDSASYDRNCPFTGGLAVKKELLKGKVIKKDTNKSATIEWFRSHYVPKYERYELKRSRLRVHNPPAVNAQIGQTVLVARTRPLSKTKHHVIIKVFEPVGKEAGLEKSSSKKAVKKSKKKVEENEVKENDHESR